MATTSVRNYQCTTPASAASPTGVWSHRGNATWQIRPAWWPFISAYVVRRPYAPPSLLTVAAETALLLEHTNWRAGHDLSWSAAAMSCPSHMSRFLTESLGLCVAIESAAAYGWHPLRAILDADRLSNASPLYVGNGSRPDFVVETGTGWHGIEARGRRSRGPVGSQRPIFDQKKKLAGMHTWSDQVAIHPHVAAPPSWSMSWAWITDSGTSVDHFDPGEPVDVRASDEQAIWRQMSDISSDLANRSGPRVRVVEALGRPVSVASRPIQEDHGYGDPVWLTVACWSERMTSGELQELQTFDDVLSDDLSQELLEEPNRATIGAFMGTAITGRQPRENEVGSLLAAIARTST